MLNLTTTGRRRRPASHRVYKEALPRRIPNDKRERIEQAIEAHFAQADALIRVLDQFDGDIDLEHDDSDLELSHGCGSPQGGWSRTAKGFWLDDQEEDVADDEWSLGWPADHNQDNAIRSCSNGFDSGEDLEYDAGDDREAGADDDCDYEEMGAGGCL
jgi:hypothetical protein